MTYAVEWTPAARRAIERLPESAAAAALDLIYGALAEEPYRVGKPLQFEYDGRLSARRGDYRVIYSVDDKHNVVYIHLLGHRRDVYRSR